ncbi:MAG: NAD(P)/FAD-dependent oxidoreductase [Anaerolineales bacterium]|nr:NAD(P)/FAD-dependent oxidoreductase [Anaerolineales bacterium]
MSHEILILGGGPSGLSTALHLAKNAPRLAPAILILEKETHPRFKLCAGGLVIDAEIILERLGLDANEVPHIDAARAHFDFAGGGLNIAVKNNRALRIIRRDEFDAWLAKKARESGIEIREGIAVKNIITDKDGVTVETDCGNFRAKMVVGADGSNGITRRCIFPNAPVYTARALEVITNVAQTSSLRHHKREAYFDFFPVPENIAGYTWDFPTQVKGAPARCWGIYDTNLLANAKRPALKETLASEMARRGFDLNDYELKGHPIRWYHPSAPLSAPRVLLVGDSAGADSLFGEGISIALGYGFIAAQEIDEAFQRDDFSFGKYKRRVAASGLGQTLFARWILTNIIYTFKWKWFQFLLWRVFQPIVLMVAYIFVLNWSKRLK